MDCKKTVELLPLLIDGELDNEQKSAVLEHLKACSSCQKELKIYENIKKSLSYLPQISPSEKFSKNLSDMILEEKEKKRVLYKYSTINKYLGLAATAAAIFICVFTLNANRLNKNDDVLIENVIINQNEKVPDDAAQKNEKPSIYQERIMGKDSQTGQNDVGKEVEEPLQEQSVPQAIAFTLDDAAEGSQPIVGETFEEADKVKNIFYIDSINVEAQEILSEYPKTHDEYVIPKDKFFDVTDELSKITYGYFDVVSYQALYDSYKNKEDASDEDIERLQEIEKICSYGYVSAKK